MQIEIFKAGKRLDAHGNEFDITVDNLQQVVDSYNPAYHEAPIVIGHPKMNTPAYAWVESVSLDGDVLKANLKQIDPEFNELVKSGKYKKVSASFYTPDSPSNPVKGAWSLRHVGFLGAMPPAVKGLKEPIFADDETGVIDFTEDAQADEQSAQNAESDPKNPSNDEPKPNPEGEDVMTDDDKKELEALRAENARLKAEKHTAMLKAKQADNANFAEKLITDGKLAPVVKEKALDLLNSALNEDMAKQDSPEFNENDGMVAKVKDFLASCPQVVEMGEQATADKAGEAEGDFVEYAENADPNRVELDKKARAYMKKHNVDYQTAIQAVIK